MTADFRVLLAEARHANQKWISTYWQKMGPLSISKHIASIIQEYTIHGIYIS